MPEYTRPATWEDLERLATLLSEAHAEYALVGGYAIASHGFNRQSEDIDLLVNPTAENSHRWIVALSQLPDQATRALEQEPDVFADDKRYALRVNDEFTVDIMPSVAGHSWDEMQQYIQTVDGVASRSLMLTAPRPRAGGSRGRPRSRCGAASWGRARACRAGS